MPRRTFAVSNIAGGDRRVFLWSGRLSDNAIRHIDRQAEFGGALFSGDAAEEAADHYEQIKEDREYVLFGPPPQRRRS
jgi:hypothetical protein